MTPAHAILLLVAAQRGAELALAWRNTRRLRAAGAIEVGARHYPLLVLLHAGWLAVMVLMVPASAPIQHGPLALYAVLLAARAWTMASLGDRWTTRILTLPGAPLVRRGPYRWLRHPNYWVVAGEIAVVPLIFALWPVAVVFSLLNGILLAHRIAIEDAALASNSL